MKIHITLDTQYGEDKDILALVLPLLQGAKANPQPQPAFVMDEAMTKPILEEETEEEPKTEEPQVEVPTPVVEVNEQPKEEPKKTISAEEWEAILSAAWKKFDLFGVNAGSRPDFNSLVQKTALKYGSNKPKLLTPEKRYEYVTEVFNQITFDPIKGFEVGESPKETPF